MSIVVAAAVVKVSVDLEVDEAADNPFVAVCMLLHSAFEDNVLLCLKQ